MKSNPPWPEPGSYHLDRVTGTVRLVDGEDVRTSTDVMHELASLRATVDARDAEIERLKAEVRFWRGQAPPTKGSAYETEVEITQPFAEDLGLKEE